MIGEWRVAKQSKNGENNDIERAAVVAEMSTSDDMCVLDAIMTLSETNKVNNDRIMIEIGWKTSENGKGN